MCSASGSGTRGSASAAAASSSPRASRIRARPIDASQVAGLLLEGLPVAGLGAVEVARLLDHLGLFGLELGLGRHQLVDEPVDLLLRVGADEHAHRLTVPERHHRGDALALDRLQQGVADGVGVDVQLREREGAGALGRHLLQDRAEGPARGAPGSPHVDHHGPSLRALDHELFEGVVGDVDHVLGGGAHRSMDPFRAATLRRWCERIFSLSHVRTFEGAGHSAPP